MAVASDYAGWVRELDTFEASADGDDVGRDNYDPRHETSSHGMSSSRQTSRVGIGTSRRGKERVPSQADELQQEMKLLNWHKLANEAALKAAIIKTNKLKREDAHVTRAMLHDDMDDKQLRIQQIIEEEQLRPLEVNAEFFRDFASKEQRDDAKLESDVQRHVQHLKRLKATIAQREDVQRRRQKYREGMLELSGGSRSNSLPKTHKPSSNQDDEQHEQQHASTRHQRSSSKYSNRAGGNAGAANAQVICSLDKLMELEQRIRHLEDAGLGADALDDDDLRNEHGGQGANGGGASDVANAKGGAGLHFSKRRSVGGPHEPSKTVYAVKPAAGGNGAARANKARAKDKSRATASARSSKPQGTFLTALPDNKLRQLRRMGERERRQFLKNEKASDERARGLKQDVVIDGWLDRKRQAASNRKAVSSQVRNAQSGMAARNAPANAVQRDPAGSAARSTGTGHRLGGGKTLKALPPPPRVRAPAVGAASGRRIANPHAQKFDDIKKGYEKRNEALKRTPTNVRASHSLLDARVASTGSNLQPGVGRASSIKVGSSTHTGASTLGRTASQRVGASSTATDRRIAAGNGASGHNHAGRGLNPTAPVKKPMNSNASQSQRLPAIPRASSVVPGPQFGITNSRSNSNNKGGALASSMGAQGANSALGPASAAVSQRGVALPRLANHQTTMRTTPAPSPPPLALKNTSMPQFSRLHKR